jgi:predicted ATPase/DNA-binding winged helix-turn-helix (wHTH) protein
MSQISESEYEFFGFRVLAESAQVLRGHELVPLTPKAVAMLVSLIERRDRAVTKEELLDLVWPNVTVEEGNVAYTISLLRQILGREIIQTIPKVGYRFVAELRSDATMAAANTNLPIRLRRLIGRDADLDRLVDLVQAHPLVTLTGPPGVGKSSVARMLGRRLLRLRAGDGVWFIDVPRTSEVGMLAGVIAALIGMKLRPGADPVTELAQLIGKRRMTVILDGCEATRTATASLAEGLIQRCDGLSIIATSRVTLGAPRERVFRLRPLATGSVDDTAEQAAERPAVALLLDRAQASDVELELGPAELACAASLCRMLDGLPLAIEIVGGRVASIGFDIVQSRLSNIVLQIGSPLRSAFDLSWSLLSDDERRLLIALSVFAGSFDFAAARDVADLGVPDAAFIERFGALIDHSLIVVEPGARRYRLLDTIRSYVAEQLTGAARQQLDRAMAICFVNRLATAHGEWNRSPEALWRDRLAPDLDNIRASLTWALNGLDGDKALGVALAGRCGLLWSSLSLHGEARRWLEQSVKTAEFDALPAEPAADALRGYGYFLSDTDPVQAEIALACAETLYRSIGHDLGRGRTLACQGMLAARQGMVASAETALLQARSLLQGADWPKSHAYCLSSLAFLYATTNRENEAMETLQEALRAVRPSKDPSAIALIELSLAEACFLSGDSAAAIEQARCATERYRTNRDPVPAVGLLNLAIYLESAGQKQDARALAAEALPLVVLRDDELLVSVLELIALLRHDADPAASAALIGWADATLTRRTRPRQPAGASIYRRTLAALSAILGAAALATALRDGADWTSEDAAMAGARLLKLADPGGAKVIPFSLSSEAGLRDLA